MTKIINCDLNAYTYKFLFVGEWIGNGVISNLSGIENFTNLKVLHCQQMELSNLDLSFNNQLLAIFCEVNNILSLNVSGLTSLQQLQCSQNQLSSLDVSGLTNLRILSCGNNQIPILNVSGLTNLRILSCGYNQISSLDVPLLTNLQQLECSNNHLTSLDVSLLTNLQQLQCSNNHLTSLDVSLLTNLQQLQCSHNQLTSLDVTDLLNLTYLDCYGNQLTSLDVTNLLNLTYLRCSGNQLSSINTNNLIYLQNFYCDYNQLSSLNVSNSTYLNELSCDHNNLTNLNVSNLMDLGLLMCHNNQLINLNLKNTQSSVSYSFFDNPNLQYICTDEEDVAMVQQKINEYGYTSTCHVNSYCSFSPGGTFYTINGNNRFDGNNNGCESSDVGYPYLKFEVTDGTNNGNFIANETGAYFYDVHPANHTLTPVLQNPSYFFISPTSFSVDFPTQASPFLQDFCITPNGVHHDLEVTVIPLGVARPGFDVSYKIVYKNNGNQLEDATVTFAFDDNVMDFIDASTNITNQSLGLLSWNVGMITPFLSGSIIVSFNLNSPMETPAVNAGDVLPFTSTVNGLFTDETPTDNIFTLNQTVVNSYDPNDKTCLEGETIDPSMIGKYVHYQIRFENTGTFPAQNIVVKDMIDATKFDVSSLQMVSSSHSCYTRINGNKVEFIFENINLPFDDANNDGYIVFKIKTLPTLTINSTISNTAEIYFDYNFPIVTNTATSTYQTLANPSFDFENEFTLYPNPAKNTLNITSKNNLEITSVEIYNLIGQLVIVKPNFSASIDVSNLASGTYFIKVNSEKGSGNGKFVKE